MIYEVDQSGKVEDTAKDTIICIARGTDRLILLLPRKEKRILQTYFRSQGKIRVFVLTVFSALITLAIFKTNPSSVLIDREYYGKEKIIRDMIYEMIGNHDTHLAFGLIGKKSPAHYGAYEAYLGRLRIDGIVSAKTIIQTIKKDRARKTD